MSYITKSVTIIITLYVFTTSSYARPGNFYYSDYNNNIKTYTRQITLKKQGVLMGMVVELKNRAFPPVEIFRGIPYAAPPIGDFRFMPTRSATSWSEVRKADSFGPVCPQTFPNETEMSNHTREYFRRLKPYLENESEDCLYLNIYAPHKTFDGFPRKYPVMVYIHGESFEWNSGNPYDGSVLAAYGQVIVVTLNFRLGILGFLNIDVEEISSQSNFGLVDLMAALVWIKENIEAFNGDPDNITLFGHGTGAACASLFTMSPLAVQNNIKHFHRAILMSGTALADWALATHHRDITYQVAKALNCPIGNKFADCLRKKRLKDIMSVPLVTEPYKPRFGPVVDSRLVPNDPKKSMTQYTDIFKRFELMYGVTEQESIHLSLGEVALQAGMLEKERNDELRKYMRSRCEFTPEICLVETLSRYNYAHELKLQADQEFGDYTGHEPDKASLARDELLDILSDARTVAPVVQTGLYHSARNMQSYFYVFTHKTQSMEHISF